MSTVFNSKRQWTSCITGLKALTAVKFFTSLSSFWFQKFFDVSSFEMEHCTILTFFFDCNSFTEVMYEYRKESSHYLILETCKMFFEEKFKEGRCFCALNTFRQKMILGNCFWTDSQKIKTDFSPGWPFKLNYEIYFLVVRPLSYKNNFLNRER